MGSIESWSRFDLHSDLDGHDLEDAELFVAQEDVKDFLFRLAITRALSRFFAFQEVDPELLREEFGGTLPPEAQSLVDAGLLLHPTMGVLPVGFSWAFHPAHSAHEYLASVALPDAPLIRDRRAVPDLLPSRLCLLIYAIWDYLLHRPLRVERFSQKS